MHDNTLVDIGSCGLHIVHGAFRDGAKDSEWDIGKLLSSLHYLFKDTPARREDFTTVTKSQTFPLKFCNHRWVENAAVAERALHIWKNVKCYVGKVVQKILPNPGTTSFDTVQTCCNDVLTVARLSCFLSVAKQVEPFLSAYQTDRPMLPFLGEDMFRLMKSLMQRFMKSEVLHDISKSKIMPLYHNDKNKYIVYDKIDIGFAAEQELKSLYSAKKISAVQVMEFRIQCRSFLMKVVAKLMNKAPLKYPLVRYMSCLDPREMSKDKETSVNRMKHVLKILNDAGRIKGGLSTCDDVIRQYIEFLDTTVAEKFGAYRSFKPSGGSEDRYRVDVLLREDMGNSENFDELWKVVKCLLLLSHGQASVERGFSVNKEIEVENLHEESVVAQRLICDHVASVGGIRNVQLSKQLLMSAASARQNYTAHLEDQRRQKLREEGCQKRKAILDEIKGIKTKRRRLETEIDELTKSADKYADKAETTGCITFVTKSNSLRRTAKGKKEQLQDVVKSLDEKVESLKN
jgi:hypothetical protein